jgi:hypothetical protein
MSLVQFQVHRSEAEQHGCDTLLGLHDLCTYDADDREQIEPICNSHANEVVRLLVWRQSVHFPG